MPIDHAGNKTDVVKALLSAGAAPDGGTKIQWKGCSYEWSALTRAAQAGQTDILDALLRAGADIGRHPQALPLAAKCGQVGAVRRLLEAGADVDATTNWRLRDRPALESAAMYASIECVRLLVPRCRHQLDIALRAAIELSNDDTPSPPNDRRAVRRESAVLLLQEGANATSALATAAACADEQLAQLLLDAGADPNEKNEAGETPLHIAARAGQHRVVRQLLAAGAKPTATTPEGKTPYALADEAYRQLRIDDARLVLLALRAREADDRL